MGTRIAFINRQTIAAFLLGSALVLGLGAAAVEHAVDHHMGGRHGQMDSGDHAERMLKHLYKGVDATDAQKAKIDPLVKAALADLKPVHEQLHALHKQVLELLTKPTIDRAALEAKRAEGIALADKASKRLVQLLADVGDTLTPAQRQKLADHFAKMRDHGPRGH